MGKSRPRPNRARCLWPLRGAFGKMYRSSFRDRQIRKFIPAPCGATPGNPRAGGREKAGTVGEAAGRGRAALFGDDTPHGVGGALVVPRLVGRRVARVAQKDRRTRWGVKGRFCEKNFLAAALGAGKIFSPLDSPPRRARAERRAAQTDRRGTGRRASPSPTSEGGAERANRRRQGKKKAPHKAGLASGRPYDRPVSEVSSLWGVIPKV